MRSFPTICRLERRFDGWVATIEALPRRQTRVLTWPLVTVFGFIAQPDTHMFMKPNTIRAAARAYGYALPYQSRPNWTTYAELLDLAAEKQVPVKYVTHDELAALTHGSTHGGVVAICTAKPRLTPAPVIQTVNPLGL